MNEIKLEIDGKQQGFNEVWVHLQDVSDKESVEYRISIAAASVREVFDPYSTKESDTSWSNFIQEMIGEFGTFIVEGFIDNITAIVGKREKVYVWVISTVDEVGETKEAIYLIGRAVPCMPSRFFRRGLTGC